MKRPNIIFLIQDQMQQQVIRESSGCIMPNLHKLMEDGINFQRAYTCNAVCSPSRASLLTGTLPHVHGMVDCTHTVPPYRANYDESLDTITAAIHDAGYQVSYYGKWHIERTHKLEKFGIDRYETEMHIPGFDVTMEDRVTVETPGYAEKTLCGVFREGAEHTEEHYVYQRAMEDIEANAASGKPFCTFISTYAPHDPYCVPREVYDLYEGAELSLPESFEDPLEGRPAVYRRMQKVLHSALSPQDYKKAKRCYYSYCTLVDLQIGRLIEYLKKKDLYDDTLIVCMSDHGDLMGAHGLMTKSVPAFEETYHIPLVMKLPGSRLAGKNVDFFINAYEIGPTVLDLAGCRPLRGDKTGISMRPFLMGEKTGEHYAFAEFFGQRFSYTQRLYWKGKMKYVFNAFDNDELYDLEKDPYEMTNRSEDPAYADIKQKMCSEMWELVKGSGDDSLADAEYFPLRIAPVGPGKKSQRSDYAIYNKKF